MATQNTLIKDVTLYKDFNLKESWGMQGGWDGQYDVEFKGEKARVICNLPFIAHGDEKSRFNKLTMCGSWTGRKEADEFMYALTVNGYKVFFKITHNIFGESK